MGDVYRARDLRLERRVALEILPAARADDPEFLERFRREARDVAALNHPNICTLYDVAEYDDASVLVMESARASAAAPRTNRFRRVKPRVFTPR